MKKNKTPRIPFRLFRLKPLLLLALVSLFPLIHTSAQSSLSRIEKVFIERPSLPLSSEVADSDSSPYEPHHTPAAQGIIQDGDVLVFEIPGFNDYMHENSKVLRSVVLRIEDIELPEFQAFIESNVSDLVMFRVNLRKLDSENRKKLFQLPGRATKKILIGVKIDETNNLTFFEPTRIYFNQILNWGLFGWLLIAIFIVFYLSLIFKYKMMIKDSVINLTDEENTNTYYSFSKAQFAFWTFIIVASFIFIWTFTTDLQSINTTALILLGITSATIVTSNLIGVNEEQNTVDRNELLKARTKTEKTSFLVDIISDASGISIHRLQALIFNLVFGIAFIHQVLTNYSMPEFNEVQLILLGLSNGTYAFLKTSENKKV
jgi:hypothetical protein